MIATSERTTRERAGIAMATALGGLVIIGVMIAGVFFTSNQELRVGTNTFVQERAFRAAEYGVNASLASWNNAEMLLLAAGDSKEIVYDFTSQGWRDTVTITRLNATAFLIGSTGTAFGGIQGTSRKRTALLVRISVPSLETKAALTSAGDIQLGNTPISGYDTDPLGWTSCPSPDPAVAAVVMADEGEIEFKNQCPKEICLLGNPQLVESDVVEDPSTYTDFDDETWSSILMNGAKVYTSSDQPPNRMEPVVTGGVCDRNADSNLGDPNRNNTAGACESYFPIIHAQGEDYKVQFKAGTGQGILLVDGDLEISGDFTFYGPVIVKGRFESKGGAKVHGALMVGNMEGGKNQIDNFSTVVYSSCAIRKAFENALPPKRVVERAWMEVF